MPSQRVAILGAAGQLGQALAHRLKDRVVTLSRHDCDITQADRVREVLDEANCSTVINAAAYTNVDGAEKHEDLCRRINVEAVQSLAQACRERRIKLVQLSTDYVFGHGDGDKPLNEQSPPNPISVYGKSKLDGERAAERADDCLVVRTCGLYAAPGDCGNTRNFANRILELAATRDQLKVVNNQICSPSYAPHVAEGIVALIDCRAEGVVHVVNRGSLSWWELAAQLVRGAGFQTEVIPIPSAEYPQEAQRPGYSVLGVEHYEQLTGKEAPSWQDAAREYLERRITLAVDPPPRP